MRSAWVNEPTEDSDRAEALRAACGELLPIALAAEPTKVKANTIRVWVHRGKVPCYTLHGKGLVFTGDVAAVRDGNPPPSPDYITVPQRSDETD